MDEQNKDYEQPAGAAPCDRPPEDLERHSEIMGAWKPEEYTEKPRFSASRKEILAAILMYVLAYIYVLSLDTQLGMENYTLFTLGFLAFGEWMLWKRPRTWESWLWLGCTLLLAARLLFWRGMRVFDSSDATLLLHAYAVYWLICRAGLLHGGKSSILLPLDGLLGFLILPFGNFFLRIRTLWFGVRSLRKTEKKTDALAVVATVFAVLFALGLLYFASQLLSDADERFDRPLWIGREVTGERKYYNSSLSTVPFSAWKDGMSE